MIKLGAAINKQSIGLVAGLIGPWIGFVIYGNYYAHKYLKSFDYFVTEAFIGTKAYQSPIATLSLLFNLLLFLLVLRFDWERCAKGILIGTFVYVPIIVFLFLY
jgi:hypothetical protein